MLQVRELCKEFTETRKVQAVRNLTFEVQKGRFLAIIGRSGSGKSSLLGMIGGISRPTNGSVTIDGCDQWLLGDDAHADFRNTKIGFVFQFASLLPTLRAIDNVALPAIVGAYMEQGKAYARARALLACMGLSERFDFYPNQLSGGEQRRVAIARALINSPDILLADEPTADLDEETEEEILNLLAEINHTFNLTMVVVTHNPSIANRADQILEMRSGEGALRGVLRPVLSLAGAQAQSREAVEIVRAKASNGCNDSTSLNKHNGSNGSRAENGLLSDEDAKGDNGAKSSSAGAALHVDSGARHSAVPSMEAIFDDQAQDVEPVLLGIGLERFIGKLIIWAVPILFLIWGINTLVAQYERHMIADKTAERQALEELAMRDLRAEIKDIKIGKNNSYDVSIYLRNMTENRQIFVMSPTLRAFVQVGTGWQEVPLTPGDKTNSQVLNITGNQIYHFVLEPNVSDFAQILPYYMHVRFSNDMLISPSSHPKNDLIERSDNYYVYLKPHDADDTAILQKMKFPGKPPIWIPMPPH